MEDGKIIFTDEEGSVEEFYVVDETRVNDVNYLLVCEEPEGDSAAYILKDISSPDEAEAIYEFVGDEAELSAVADIFALSLEDEELI